MGPVVDGKQMLEVLEAIEGARKEGFKLLCGGERVGGNSPSNGYFIAPTVFDDVPPRSKLGQQEVFGPVLALMKVGDFEEAMRVANDVEYGLTSSIYTKDTTRALTYAERMESGMLHVNSATVGGEAQAPFGGTKATGVGGREMGASALEIFSEIKTVYLDYNPSFRGGNLY